VAFSADGRRFATGGRDGVVRVWSVAGGPPVAVLRGQRARIYDVGFGPTADRVVSAADDGTVRMWDAGKNQAWTVSTSPTYRIAFDGSGRRIATAGLEGPVRVWDPTTARLTNHLPLSGEGGDVAFYPNEEAVVATDGSRVLRWQISGSSARAVAHAPKGRVVYNIALDGAGRRIVYVDDQGHVAVRDLRTGAGATLRGAPEPAVGAVISPDGRYVAAAPDRDVVVWRVDAPARPLRIIKVEGGQLNDLDFSRDDRILTTGSDRTARVFDVRGRQLAVMRGQEEELSTAIFSVDGTQVLSASQDGSLWLFDARTGAELAELLSPGDRVLYDVTQNRDGTIAVLYDDSSVQVFPCDVCGSLAGVRRLGLSRAPRPLSADERRQFLAAAG
jgi:WD40 repeat protein